MPRTSATVPPETPGTMSAVPMENPRAIWATGVGIRIRSRLNRVTPRPTVTRGPSGGARRCGRSRPPQSMAQRQSRDHDEHQAFAHLFDGAEEVAADPAERAMSETDHDHRRNSGSHGERADPPTGRQGSD